jgi:hypothetical protein
MTKSRLFQIVDIMWQKWKDYDDKEGTESTFCNMFVNDVMKYFGYAKFEGEMANDMFDIMNHQTPWKEVNALNAIEAVKNDFIVIAAQKADGHGHVCIITPGKGMSGTYNKVVPNCSNIGRTNFKDKLVSFAFRKEPTYFLYAADLKDHPPEGKL